MSIALVQDKNSNTSSISFTSSTTAGNLLVCVVTAFVSSSSPGGVSISTPSTSGFTWTLAENSGYSDTLGSPGHYTYDSGEVAIYYIANASSMSSSTTTTASISGSSPSVTMRLYEFSGAAGSTPVDTYGSSANSTTSANTVTAGNLTTSVTDLIFVASTASPTSAGSGYTSGVVNGDQYILNQASGTISTNYGSSAALWATAAVAFKTGSVTVSPSGVGATFGINNPTIAAGATVSPSAVGATFGLGSVFVPQPGTAYPTSVGATFGVAITTVGNPINYGNVVSGSANLPGGVNTTYFYVRWQGWLTVDIPGVYDIGLNVADGGDLYIGTQPIVNALGASQSANSTTSFTQSKRIELAANVPYPLVLEWQHGTGADYECQLLWTTPDGVTEIIPTTNLELTGRAWNGNSSQWFPNTWY